VWLQAERTRQDSLDRLAFDSHQQIALYQRRWRIGEILLEDQSLPAPAGVAEEAPAIPRQRDAIEGLREAERDEQQRQAEQRQLAAAKRLSFWCARTTRAGIVTFSPRQASPE
jgi:hypothetical protein